jgi:dolichyl-phosphate-mannose-protein mannosyltransferase
MLDTTALPPNPDAPQASGEPIEDTRAPVGKDAGAPQVTADAEMEGWHGDAEDDGRLADTPGEAEAVGAPVGAKVDEIVELEMDSEARKLVDEAMRDSE